MRRSSVSNSNDYIMKCNSAVGVIVSETPNSKKGYK